MQDILIVNPAAAHGIYGPLGEQLVAVEPPLWCRLLAGAMRDKGWETAILDAEALRLDARAAARMAAEFEPRITCIAVYGHQPSASTQQMWGASEFAIELRKLFSDEIIMVGGHPSALPERTLQENPDIDYVGVGEGPLTLDALLASKPAELVPGLVYWRGAKHIKRSPPAPLIEDMKVLHGDAWDMLPMSAYRAHNWQCFGDLSKRQPYASIYTSLGCPYKCLAGDTLINTIHGDIPIRDLAKKYGDAGVPVYTFDPERRAAFIADSVSIRKYGEGEQLVRVHFDDGTYIDCTPDHGFLQFKWGNGKSPSAQWECEAKDLQAGAHVRAMRVEINPQHQRAYVTWARRAKRLRSRMIKDYEAGRRLARSEHVHHEDRDTLNDAPGNLEHCASAVDHFALHPEIAERMRANNPAKGGLSSEWRDKIGSANRGKQRSQEARVRYRESKLGAKNPNFKHGERAGTKSRIAEVNHRVVRVEWLAERGDVYCLTVPATGWFFANNVLVKNCSFCCINAPFASNRYRTREPADVIAEIEYLHDEHGVETFKITDEMFVLNERHYTAICQGLAERGLGAKLNIWAYARVDTVKPENLALLKAGGIRWLALGIESASKHVRDGARKTLKQDDIVGTVRAIQNAGINVIGNFIVGLPDDTRETIEETFQLAAECNCEFMNVYAAQAYPGSALYDQATKEGWTLPKTWAGYSQHNEHSRPLDTKTLSGREVLKFRDEFFIRYFSSADYQGMLRKKFGENTLQHVRKMLEYRLKRNLLEESVHVGLARVLAEDL